MSKYLISRRVDFPAHGGCPTLLVRHFFSTTRRVIFSWLYISACEYINCECEREERNVPKDKRFQLMKIHTLARVRNLKEEILSGEKGFVRGQKYDWPYNITLVFPPIISSLVVFSIQYFYTFPHIVWTNQTVRSHAELNVTLRDLILFCCFCRSTTMWVLW